MPAPYNSLPSSQQPIANSQNGIITSPWLQFFATLVSQPGKIAAVRPTGTPFQFTASSKGSLVVAGGTVSAITLTRAGTAVLLGITAGVIPMAQGDVATVSYSAAPTVNFVPS